MSQLRVDSIRSESGTGAVDFPNGVNITGVVTATDFYLNGTPIGAGVGQPVRDVDKIFSWVPASATITEDITFDSDNAGSSNSYVVSIIPNVTVGAGVAVTVGAGKTTVINALNLQGVSTSI